MMRLLWHVWRRGHSVTTKKGMTRAMADTSRGWLVTCSCGLTVAR